MELTKKRIQELSREFKYITRWNIQEAAKGYKTEKRLLLRLKNDNRQAGKEFAAPLPVYIEIELNWNKSIYGLCPRAEMRWKDDAGNYNYIQNAAYAGGWGYDKESAAVAECLNRFKNLRYSIRKKNFKNAPYGIHKHNENILPYFEGGVGINCYSRILNWIGYNLDHVASGKTYDKYIITKKSGRRAAL